MQTHTKTNLHPKQIDQIVVHYVIQANVKGLNPYSFEHNKIGKKNNNLTDYRP